MCMTLCDRIMISYIYEAQEAAEYVNFKGDKREQEWEATERLRRVQWKVYAMSSGRGIVNSVALPMIDTV